MNLGNRRAEELREYEAHFVIWTEAVASEPAPAQPPAPGALVVPAGPEWPGETEGTATHEAPPSEH
jgi:hypothetical protein